MSLQEDFVQAIIRGDIPFLRMFLYEHLEMLEEPLQWKDERGGSNTGYAVQCAARYNLPEVIKFLVVEKGADVNRPDSGAWRPLHDAKDNKSYAAAAMLLSLGANPEIKRDKGDDTFNFCQSPEVQSLINPRYREEQRAKKLAGNWVLNTPTEVQHDYELPEGGHRLTEIFNFETRRMTSIIEKGAGLSHDIHFFDNIPDRTILRQALKKLQDLGGEADERSIDGPVIRNKMPKSQAN